MGAKGTVCQVGKEGPFTCVRGNVNSAGEASWSRFDLLLLPVQQGAPSPFPKNRRSLQLKITCSNKESSS